MPIFSPSGAGTVITRPALIYVNNLTGDDDTAMIGREDLPFASLQAAYTAGVNGGNAFVVWFANTSITYSLQLGADFSAYCRGFVAVGGANYVLPVNSTVQVAIDGSLGSNAVNADGQFAWNGEINIADLFLTLNASAQNISAYDGGIYNGMSGAVWTIKGSGLIQVTLQGGGIAEALSGGSSVNSGDGGQLILQGALVTAETGLGGIAPGTAGGSGLPGNPGTVEADGCDLRIGVIPSASATFGRCSYNGGWTVSNDKGGNAIY